MSDVLPEEATQALLDSYAAGHPAELSRELEANPIEDILPVLDMLSPLRNAQILGRMSPELAGEILSAMEPERFAVVMAKMYPTRGAIALSRLHANRRKELLDSLGDSVAAELREFLSYPEDSAGRLMDTQIVALQQDNTVQEALERIRKRDGQKDFDEVHVVDERGILMGEVPLQTLALSAPEEILGELMKRAIAITVVEPADEVSRLLNEGRLYSLAVVDYEGKLLGVIRYDSLMEASRETAVENMQTMVGGSKDERALSSAWFAVRKRQPWLQINLLTAFLAAAVVGLFEGVIAQVTALAVLLPVVAGQSGNTGAQALAVAIRGLTLREVRVSDWVRVVRKEAIAGFFNGVAVAIVTGIGVYVWSQSLGLVAVIALAMVISMVIAGAAGAAIPMVLKALNQDPAASSSIILTTVTDVLGFFSFLGLAWLLMEHLPKGAIPV